MKTTIHQFFQEYKKIILATICQVAFNSALVILMLEGLIPFINAVPMTAITFGVWSASSLIHVTLLLLGILSQRIKIINFTLLLGSFSTIAILGMPLYS